MALDIELAATPFKYLNSLDRTTRERIKAKLKAIAEAPTDTRLSKPLTNTAKRSARVGSYRILFLLEPTKILVVDIGPRGQVYRNT